MRRHPSCVFGSHHASSTADAVVRTSEIAISKQLQELMLDSPSLEPRFAADLEDSDLSATLLAAGETGLPENRFPATCPFSADQLLDEGYWPEASG
ncbi:hypothetical protein Thiowin_00172 [Thiorhodovibrio winogradskyi]|uniref:Nif11 domain-containing protein n=1 Tax=Thiorhodovibrio winogradskyi TaxID=77007 RepID=A0ABZ0S3V5_9GAMM|nr:DUF29 family protein [Thiorhodovibrio winogradskyi]